MDTWLNSIKIEIQTFDWEKENKILTEEELSITTFPAIHGMPNVGLLIECKEKIIVYSSDTSINPIIKNFKKVDFLIHEATTAQEKLPYHTSLREIIDFHPLQDIEQVILVHLSDGEPYDQLIMNACLEKGKINVAYDGMMIQL